MKHIVVRLFCSVSNPITLYILVNRMRLFCLQGYRGATTGYDRDGDRVHINRATKAGGKLTRVHTSSGIGTNASSFRAFKDRVIDHTVRQ